MRGGLDPTLEEFDVAPVGDPDFADALREAAFAAPDIEDSGAAGTEGGGAVVFSRDADGVFDYVYTPAPDFTGLDEAVFTLLVEDGAGGGMCTEARMVFVVAEVNDDPTLDRKRLVTPHCRASDSVHH